MKRSNRRPRDKRTTSEKNDDISSKIINIFFNLFLDFTKYEHIFHKSSYTRIAVSVFFCYKSVVTCKKYQVYQPLTIKRN